MAQATQTQNQPQAPASAQMPFTPANVRRPPPHPATAYVEADAAQTAPQQPVQQPVQQPQPYQQAQGVVQQAPHLQQQPVVPSPMAASYAQASPYPPHQLAVQPSWDIQAWQQQQAELQRQMAEQQQTYTQQLQASQAQLEAAQQRIAEFEQAQAQAAMANLTDIDLGSLEHVDSDVAQEIRDKLIAPVIDRVAKATEARLTQATALANNALEANNSTMTKWREEQQRSRTAEVNRAIYARHPDLEQMIRSPEYINYMAQVIPGTLVTRGSQIDTAYREGNVDFVNHMLDEFKGGQPGLAQIATPPINNVVATHAAVTDAPTYSYGDLDEMVHKMNRREISIEDYRKFLVDFNAAEAAGRVQ